MRQSRGRWIALAAVLAVVAAVVVLAAGNQRSAGNGAGPSSAAAITNAGPADPRAVWPAGSLLVSHVTGAMVTVVGPDGNLTRLDGDPGPLAALAPDAGTGSGGTVQVLDQTTGQISEFGPAGWRGAGPTLGADLLPGAVGFTGTTAAGLTGWLDPAGAAVFVRGSAAASSVAVGSNPTRMLFAPAGMPGAGTAYILSAGNSALDPGSITSVGVDGAITRLAVGANPTDMAIAGPGRPDAGTVYAAVTGDGTVAVLDGGTGEIRQLTGFRAPMRIALAGADAPDPRAVYVLDADGLQVVGEGSVRRSVDLPDEPTDLVVAPAGTPNAGTVYVSDASGSLAAIDPATLAVTGLRVGRHPTAVTVFPAGSPRPGEIATANLIDGTVSLLSPDGSTHRSIDVGDLPVDVRVIGTSA